MSKAADCDDYDDDNGPAVLICSKIRTGTMTHLPRSDVTYFYFCLHI